MDWSTVLSSEAEDVEKNEELLERLYGFFLQTDLPQQGSSESELVEDKPNLLKLVSLLRSVVRVKGLEAQAAEEELRELQEKYDSTTANVGTSERDLLEQVVQLEKDIRQRDFTIGQLKRQSNAPSPSIASEVRYLRDQVDSLERRGDTLQRSLDHERGENERISGELAAERQRGRERDREVERLHQNLEDYRRQLESSTDRRLELSNYREMIGQREDEIRKQIDKIEELVEERDNLEKQLSQMTALLGQVEEKRLSAIKDMENMKVALSEADSRCHDLEERNAVLEGQVSDLGERLQLQSGADEQIMTLVNSKASQWQASLAAKQVELDDCQKKMVFLEEQLRVAQRQTDRAMLLKLKKQVQEREAELSSAREELSSALERVELLTSQLDETRSKADPANINAQLKLEVDQLQGQVGGLQSELGTESRRREEAELHVEEKDAELAGALARLGEYERGEYGLYEAVQEIKMKKDELAVRDKDIAELTQQVNRLDNHLNVLSEQNEALRERCGLGSEDTVDVAPLRSRRSEELEQLKRDNHALKLQLELLEEEKLNLRKQLIERSLSHKPNKISPAHPPSRRPAPRSHDLTTGHDDVIWSRDGVDSVDGDSAVVVELRRKVKEMEQRCQAERRQSEMAQRDRESMRGELLQAQQQVRQFEAVLKELSGQLKSAKAERKKERKDVSVNGDNKYHAVERLISMLEAQGAHSAAGGGAGGGKYDITLQLKSDVSELSGQNSELRSRLGHCEGELKSALRLAERRECEVESLKKDLQELRKVRAGFQALVLPEGIPPTSSDVITRLNEHLLNVLSQLHGKEVELGRAQEALEKFQRKFAVIIHQQGILYQEYSDSRKQWEEEREKLVSSKNELAGLREGDQVRLEELAKLHESLSSEDDSQRKRLIEMSRRVTLLQVNEKTLSRRYTLIAESEAALRKENDRLRQDMVTMEKAITERMGYLQRHKEAASFKLSSLQHELSESVPRSELEKANMEYGELVLKYQQCLQKQTAYASETSTIERLQAEVKTLTDHLESTKQDMAAEKQRNHLLEQQLQLIRGTAGASVTRGASSSGGGGGGVSEALAEKVATLEIKELNERQRADLASVRCKQLQETAHQLEYRNSSLEQKFSELTQKLLQSQAREVELRDQLASSLPQGEKTSLENQIEQLKKKDAELRLQNSQLQEVAEVSRQQVVAMETKRKSHDLELSSLRHQLLDVQMQSDEKSLSGRLHHQIVALQVSEASATQRAEEKGSKVMQLEASLLRSEQELERVREALLQARTQAHKRTKHLRTTVQALRRQLVGALPLSEQERHAQLLQQLREDKREAESIRERARRDQERVQDKLGELELQHSNLQELLGVLREQSKGGSSQAAGKLMEWHAKLGEMRLKEMRVARNNERLQEHIKHLEELVTNSERSSAKLEQELVQVTKDHERCQLSWEQREAELEQEVERYQREHDSIITAANKMDPALQHTTHSKLPVAGQLEQALRRLRENSQAMEELRQKAREREGEADRMEKALNRAQGELIRREKELAELRMTTARLQHGDSEDLASEKAELKRALKSAQDSIEELKSQASQKEQVADKYQRLLKEAHGELQAATEAHKSQVASLTSKLHSQADSELSRLKKAALEAVNPPRPLHLTDSQLDRLRELEELTEEREKTNTQLRRELQEVRHEMEQDRKVSKTRVTKVQQELSDARAQYQKEVAELHASLEEKACRVVELEQEVEVMEGELSAAQQAAKQAPSRTMKALVERLRNQLAMKEKQHRALSQALLQVRADLVDTAQRTLEGEAARETHEANVKELVEKRTQQLMSQLSEVRGQLEEVRGHLDESQARETRTLEDMAKLEGQLSEKTSLVGHLEAELRQLRKAVDQARTKEQKLTREIQQLHLVAGGSAETEELRKRVKILQGRLDKQKQQTRELEEALKSAKPSVGGATGTSQPLIDSKHQSAEILKWEESKKWQRKVDTLRAKLSEKHKEMESVKKQVSSLREMLSRADREKGILQGKLRMVQKNIIESTGRPQLVSSVGKEAIPTTATTTSADGAGLGGEERHQLKSRIYQLENQVQTLERQLKLDKNMEVFELQTRCEQLRGTIQSLESQLQQQQNQFSPTSPGPRERGPGVREEGEGELFRCKFQGLGEVLAHNRETQDQLLKSQKENMRLRFEYEQAIVELPRLQAQVKDQQEYIELLSVHQDGNVRTASSSKKESVHHQHSVAELERVVSAMRKVVERLQNENSSLKKSLTNARAKKGGHMDKTAAALEEENNKLKAELERLHQSGLAVEERGDIKQQPQQLASTISAAPRSPHAKIVTENERLRKELKKEVERNEKLQLSVSTLELRNTKLQQELAEQAQLFDRSRDARTKSRDQSRDYEERVERLQVELEKKTSMLLEVRRHLREAVEREKLLKSLSTDPQLSENYLTLLREKEQLQKQVAQMKKDLDAFDPNFFEELEDLKYNYQAAVKRNVQYEEQLNSLAKQYGFPLDT